MRRKHILVAAILIAGAPELIGEELAASAPALLFTRSGNAIHVTMQAPPPELTPAEVAGQTFQALNAPGEGWVGRAGGPALPGSTRWIEIPEGKLPTLTVHSDAGRTLTDVNLAPMPLESDNPTVAHRAAFDPAAYAEDRLLPESPASLAGPFEIAGRRYALLTVTPYQCNPARRTLVVHDQLSAEVAFTLDPAATPPLIPPLLSREGKETTPPLLNRGGVRGGPAPVWREIAAALSDEPTRDEVSPRADNLGHLVIIIPNNDQAAQAIRPLVDWKKRKGYVVTLARLGGDVGNTAESIRGWLQEGWENWDIPPTFVLLIGETQGDLQMPYFPDGQNRQASWYASDNQFVTYEGAEAPDSWIPEALVGRLVAATTLELTQMVAKILGYERTPFVQSDWVEGAVLIAAGVRSCIQTNQAIRELMQGVGYSPNRFYEAYVDWPNVPDHDPINRGVDGGVGFLNFRGYNDWGNYNTGEIRDRRNGWKLPIVTGMVCGTNDFPNGAAESIGEAWVRAYNNNDPRGAVACWGPTDLYTHTWFNNTLDGEFYHLLLNRNIHTLGALTLGAKLSLIRNYPSSMGLGAGTTVGYYFYTYTLLGDPSLQVWSHQPQPIEVEFANEVARGATMLTFAVNDRDGNPVSGAYVHIYKDDDTRFGAFTGPTGEAEIATPPLADGNYLLTITGPNLVPLLDDFTVAAQARFASLDSYEIDDDAEGGSHGNDDGTLNPGETIELRVVLANRGADRLEDLQALLDTENPFIRIERAEAQFGALDADESAAGEPFILHVAPEAPDGEVLELALTFLARQDAFRTVIPLPLTGYDLQVAGHHFREDDLVPGTTRQLLVTVENVGDLDADALSGTLFCANPTIQIRQAEAPFAAVGRGQQIENVRRPFEVFAGPSAYQGSSVAFGLLLQDEAGRRDSLVFTVTLGEPVVTAPQGPDAYGYWAFDSRDTLSGMAPRYEQLQGTTNLNLQDNDDRGNPAGAAGARAVVNLPFAFRYYGQDFRRATICSNGWLAFGESVQVSWNNQELGSPMAPAAMVAPWWDDLWGGQVMTRYDQDNARFICEWRNFTDGGNRLNFAVALYDPTVIVTATGDGEILFQYAEIPQMRDYAEERVTIGLSSPDRLTTFTIRHANFSDQRTGRLASRLAVRFTTGESAELGSVAGQVTDAGTGEPLQGVRVMLEGTGFFALTDASGVYQIDGAAVGSYTVTARKLFFNESSVADVDILREEVAAADFSLTHPTFAIDADRISVTVLPDSSGEAGFTVQNDGNGPLNYRTNLNYEAGGAVRDQPWDILFDFDASAAADDQGLRGLTTDGQLLYVAGPRTSQVYPHPIYVLDPAGRLVREFNQFNVDSSVVRGYGCLDFNGRNLLAIEQDSIIEITTEGNFVRTIAAPEHPNQTLAWAGSRGTIFTKSITGNSYFEIDTLGNVVNRFRIPNNESIRTYGLAWHPADPDGYNLYISRDNPNILEEFGTRMQLLKMNPETGDFRVVRNIALEEGDSPMDITISKRLNPLLWTFALLVNRPGGDHIVGFELGPNLTWISYDPTTGTVPPGESQPFTMDFFARDMPLGRYFIVLELLHNAAGEQFDMPVEFTVSREVAVVEGTPAPLTLALEPVFPNPFNSRTTVVFTLTQEGPARLSLWDIAGRQVRELELGRLSAGRHTAAFDGRDLTSGVYLLRLETAAGSAAQKMLLLK